MRTCSPSLGGRTGSVLAALALALGCAAALRAPASPGAEPEPFVTPPLRAGVPAAIQVLPTTLPAPAAVPVVPAWAAHAQPVNLPSALRLAETANLDIAQAREVVSRAEAALLRARVTAVPNFNLGSTYTKHEGTLVKTEGNVIYANKDSLFVGGGPSLSFQITEALFAPLLARQVRTSTQAGLRRVHNDVMLAVADAYLNVLRARRRLARVEETLDYLASDRPSPMRAGSRGLLPVVEAVQAAGLAEALKSEVERVRVEILRRQEERQAAVQDFLVATAELARLVRLDPEIPLWPIEDFRFPLPLSGEDYLQRPVDQLVEVALNNRPELAENQAFVRAAVARVRTAQYRPLLPNVVLNYNWGDFGGGPDLNAPIISGGKVTNVPGFGPSGQIHHFSPRADFDVTVVWRLQNMGLGNLAEIREQQAAARQATLRLLQVRDLVVTEVVQAKELVAGWRQRLDTTRLALFDADGKPNGPVFRSLRLNFERIREVEKTRPLEVLDSIRGLNDLLEAYGQALTDYERAQFRLLRALGLPPQLLFEAVCGPAVPPQAPPGAPAARPEEAPAPRPVGKAARS